MAEERTLENTWLMSSSAVGHSRGSLQDRSDWRYADSTHSRDMGYDVSLKRRGAGAGTVAGDSLCASERLDACPKENFDGSRQ